MRESLPRKMARLRERGWRRAKTWNTAHPRVVTALSVLLAVVIGLGIVAFQTPRGTTSASRPPATPTLALPTAIPSPTATPIPFARPALEAGVAFPRWSTTAYGQQDATWQHDLLTLQRQTGARWVSIAVDLYQDSFQSTTIHPGDGTPTPRTLEEGIAYAHSLGLRVFIEPLLTVVEQPQWSGLIAFNDPAQASAWFDGYWAGYAPYVQAAEAAGAEQLGIATELQALEWQPDALWDQLISRARSVFHGKLTYDVNWNSLIQGTTIEPVPTWMANPALDYLGVSEYQPIAQSPQSLSVSAIRTVWQSQLLPVLDNLAARTGKPVVLSEVGYRNASDALYRPWDHNTSAPADPTLQAAAYTAAAQAVFGDPHVVGLFFWAWGNGVFNPSPEAAAALKAQYLSPAA
ncbi:MAG TPA: hypothetical protein VF116_15340 [Ktedonobacterales bacterium]